MDKPDDKKHEQLAFDPRHVETFLTKVRADRDAAIAKIRNETDTQVAKIRKDSYRSARALAHKTIKATREQEAHERDRYLYKVKSELKREHWTILDTLRQQVLTRVRTAFEAAWREPESQRAWCDSWIDTALSLAQDQDLHIQLGAGGNKDVVTKLKQKLKNHGGKCSVSIDKAAPAGIVITWPDHVLDGTLVSHCQDLSNEVVNQLAQTLSPAQAEDSSP